MGDSRTLVNFSSGSSPGAPGTPAALSGSELDLDPADETLYGTQRKIVSRNTRDASGGETEMIANGDMVGTRNFSAFSLTAKQTAIYVLPNRWERFLRKGVGVELRASAILISPIDAVSVSAIIHYRHTVTVIRRETRGGVTYVTTVKEIPLSDSHSDDYQFTFNDRVVPNSATTKVEWIVEVTLTSTNPAANLRTWDASLALQTAFVRLIPVGTLQYELGTMTARRPALVDAIAARDDLSADKTFHRAPLIELPATRMPARGLSVYGEKFEKVVDVDHEIPVGVTWIPGLMPDPIGSNAGYVIFRHDYTSTGGGSLKISCNGVELHQAAIVGASEGEHVLDRGYWFPSPTGSGLHCDIEFANVGSNVVRLRGRHMVRRYSPVPTAAGVGTERGRRKVLARNKAFIAGIVGSPDTYIPWLANVFSLYEADVFYCRLKLNSRWIEPEIHLATIPHFSRGISQADIHFGLFSSRQPMWHQGQTTASAPTDIKFWQRIRLVPYRVAGPTTALSLIGSMTSASGDTSVKVTNASGINPGMVIKINQEEMTVNSKSGNNIRVANRSDPTWTHAAHAVVTSWTEHEQLCGGMVFHPIRNALSVTNNSVRLEEAGIFRY